MKTDNLHPVFAQIFNPLIINTGAEAECEYCEGTGKVFYSCCGDDLRGHDIDLCPTCCEHCDIEGGELCEECGGTGKIIIT